MSKSSSPSSRPKRIVICGAQVPFTRGGAEYLIDGLKEALEERGHLVDVVALPFAYHPHPRITQSALSWRLLDLTHVNDTPIDVVIGTKFPSYLVRHPNKVVWLVHQMRQVYDWYGTPLSDFVNTPDDRAIRQTVFRMDRRGLSEAKHVYTISRNVSQRLLRFNALPSTPLYPPSRYASQLRIGAYGDYILSPSRLDRAKRLDLLLHALAHAPSDVRLIVAGTGDDRPRLERLAAELRLGERVQFLGFVDDATLIDLYANARAVAYTPVDEDYGFATVEAFGAARPVITTDDAGGVLEFVEDGRSGIVTPPEPRALAHAFERLTRDAALAMRLGNEGRRRVQTITWDRVVEALVGG
jgi:glycosyltransferase involved in cell wall biosynthesis